MPKKDFGSSRTVFHRWPTPPEPKSVFFDFQSGVKTTVLTVETKIEEPFDAGLIIGLASARPVRTPGAISP